MGRARVGSSLLMLALAAPAAAQPRSDRSGDPLPENAVARLGSTRLGHASVIQQIAYSPDGKTLISASKSIRVWDAATGQMVREMADNPNYGITSLAIAPDGRTLAWARRDEHVRI